MYYYKSLGSSVFKGSFCVPLTTVLSTVLRPFSVPSDKAIPSFNVGLLYTVAGTKLVTIMYLLTQ